MLVRRVFLNWDIEHGENLNKLTRLRNCALGVMIKLSVIEHEAPPSTPSWNEPKLFMKNLFYYFLRLEIFY